jgi:2-methylisocitrate lyase-like PEP mutase family enzyme
MSDARKRFRALHREGCFVLPNPWDAGGARRLEALGFQALASSSAAAAWALGREDGELTLDEALDNLRVLCAATGLPVNADFEAGYAADARGVAASVRLAIETGVAGLSIEDRIPGTRSLFDLPEALDRLAAAREAIAASGQDVVLVARNEGFVSNLGVAETISRLTAYAEAGADCLYAPGIGDVGAVRELVAAVAPKPVNVLLGMTKASIADLAAAGVRRISVGGALAAAAWKAFDAAAETLARDSGVQPAGPG